MDSEYKDRDFVDSVHYILPSYLKQLYVLVYHWLICFSTLMSNHSCSFQSILSQYELFFQEMKTYALVEILLAYLIMYRKIVIAAA